MTGQPVQIRIHAPADVVNRLAAEIELWPAFVRNVRVARVLRRSPRDDGLRMISIRGRQGWLPIGWRSIQKLEPEVGRITLRHFTPISAGTTATWTIAPTPDGAATDVTIEQRAFLHLPLIGRFLAERIVGPYIGRPFAQSILLDIKHVAEGGSLAGPS